MGRASTTPDTLYGQWQYSTARTPYPYDDTPSYAIAAGWVTEDGLAPGIVEDWGCGTAWMQRYVPRPWEYRGIDGAWSRFAQVHADLRTYTSNVPYAVMRHVLEHNREWRAIARNFTDSWHVRAALVLFIPPGIGDQEISEPDWPVPDISVDGAELIDILSAHGTEIEYVPLHYPAEESIQYSWEGVLLMQR